VEYSHLLASEGITEKCRFFSNHLERRNIGNNSIGIFGRAQEDDSNQEVEQLGGESLRQGYTLKRPLKGHFETLCRDMLQKLVKH